VIDLHSHLLPNIDDGSRSLDQSVGVLTAFARDGITDVVLTPHLRSSQIPAKGERAIVRRDTALESLRSAAPNGVRLHAGFEIMLDEPLPPDAIGDRRYALAGSRYYLVEFPYQIVAEFAGRVLRAIAATGVVPLVAHPERYSASTTASVGMWRDTGARVQVDATTLMKPTGRGRLARRLVGAGLADVLAADNHGDRRSLARVATFLEERDAAEIIAPLMITNPAAVLEDQELVGIPSTKIAERLSERVRRWLDL